MTEREKMLAGLPYDDLDSDLVAGRRHARARMDVFNAELDESRRMAIASELFGSLGEGSVFERPFFCDYGTNIHVGRDSFVNTNAVFLDCGEITIGDRVNIAPGVQLLGADHPREAALRAQGVELAKPVSVGDDAWIGAGVIVCPGVSVGEGSIVGAGSVVVGDVPANVMAAGNPCRVIRELL